MRHDPDDGVRRTGEVTRLKWDVGGRIKCVCVVLPIESVGNLQSMYKVEGPISKALYGSVWLCRNSKGRQSATEYVRAEIESEKSVNLRLMHHSHRHIVKMEDQFLHDGVQHLVFEYCPNGDLLTEMQAQPEARFAQAQAIHYFRQVVAAVAHLHSVGIAHRDLSLENVLLDKHNECKLCDFGLAVDVPSLHMDAVGKPNYMAPEVYAQDEYDPCKADVWSLGMMLFIMVTGVPLVEEPGASDNRFCILEAFGVHALVNKWKMEALFSGPVLELIESMLEIDPAKRITAAALKKALGKLKEIHPIELGSRKITNLVKRLFH
ncbi:unnamed protein product [Aphanomyces euteiches]